MWHKPCRTFNPWCLCIKTRCLSILGSRAGAGPWLLRFQGAGRDTAIRFTIFVICVYFVSKLIYTGMIFCGCKLLSLQWRHNEHDGVSNHQPHDYLLNRLFRRRSKKTPKLRLTGLCVGSFHLWCHHDVPPYCRSSPEPAVGRMVSSSWLVCPPPCRMPWNMPARRPPSCRSHCLLGISA